MNTNYCMYNLDTDQYMTSGYVWNPSPSGVLVYPYDFYVLLAHTDYHLMQINDLYSAWAKGGNKYTVLSDRLSFTRHYVGMFCHVQGNTRNICCGKWTPDGIDFTDSALLGDMELTV